VNYHQRPSRSSREEMLRAVLVEMSAVTVITPSSGHAVDRTYRAGSVPDPGARAML